MYNLVDKVSQGLYLNNISMFIEIVSRELRRIIINVVLKYDEIDTHKTANLYFLNARIGHSVKIRREH